jgi:uncharacterized protein
MAPRTDSFDLARLSLKPGEARRLDLDVELGDFTFGADRYAAEPPVVPVRLDLTRMASGWSLRLRLQAALKGPCMRCLEPAQPLIDVDAREISQPGGGEELLSPYVLGEELDLRGWAHDAFALALPAQITCREDCAGLCPTCGANLNEHPDHEHEAQVDPRWAKLSELKFDQ